MAMKGFSTAMLPTTLAQALGAGSPPKRYLLHNVGLEQHAKCKRLHFFLEREGTAAHRLLSVWMHASDANWGALRRGVLGKKDPPAAKHADAFRALCAALGESGGLVLTETRSTGNSAAVFVITAAELLSVETEILPFSVMRSSKGTPLKVERIVSIFGGSPAAPAAAQQQEGPAGWDSSLDSEEDEEDGGAHTSSLVPDLSDI